MTQELLRTTLDTQDLPPTDVVETAAETVADTLKSLDPIEQAEAIDVANEELAFAGLALVRIFQGKGSQTQRTRFQIIHEAMVTHQAPSLSVYNNRRNREAQRRLEK